MVGRRKKLGRWEYLIKWKGYGVDANSWEPEEHLFGCSETIDKYNGKPQTRKPQMKRVFIYIYIYIYGKFHTYLA